MNTTRHATLPAVVTLLVFGVISLHGAPPPAAEEKAFSVRFMFGLKRLTPQRWDGSVKIDSGDVLGLTGVHFEGRDAI